MELNLEKQDINGTISYAFLDNGYLKSYMTGIQKL